MTIAGTIGTEAKWAVVMAPNVAVIVAVSGATLTAVCRTNGIALNVAVIVAVGGATLIAVYRTNVIEANVAVVTAVSWTNVIEAKWAIKKEAMTMAVISITTKITL